MVFKDGNGVWKYEFSACGRKFGGECAACLTEEAALKFEDELRFEVGRVLRRETVAALLEERLSDALDSEGILLGEAVDRFLSLPSAHGRGEACEAMIRRSWGRLAEWLHANCPRIRYVQEIGLDEARGFVSFLRSLGLAAHTCNLEHSRVSQVFSALCPSLRNPFRDVPLLRGVRHEGHGALSPEEVSLLVSSCPRDLSPVLVLGLYTGMRLGDACTLMARDVARVAVGGEERLFVEKRQRKTGSSIRVPLLEPAERLVREALDGERLRRECGDASGYLFPELAESYLRNHRTPSQRFVRFLRSAGVGTQEEAEGYSRAVNRKGSHSLRHTFCSLAGMNGIPQSVVQSMVGHLTPRMAELYSRHVTDAAKAAYMERYGKQVAVLSGLPRLGAG